MAQAENTKGSTNEPFVPSSDRPEVKPDTRLSELTVRELLSVLKLQKTEHLELKAFYSKHENWKVEHLKAEMFKIEYPKVELYKVEHPDIPIGQGSIGPGPEFGGIAQGIAGLQAQIHQLSSEVAELRKAGQR